jgi:hypothetical protein
MKDDASSLNDTGKPFGKRFADACETSDDRRDLAAEEEAGRAEEPKMRNCLVCRTAFPSAWAGERVCRRCKATSAWRGGALG